MSLPRIGALPSIHQTHKVGVQDNVTEIVTTYLSAQVGVARPENGEAVAQVPCGACGVVGVYRVFDAPHARALRNRWRFAMAGAGVVFAGLLAAAFITLVDPFSAAGLALFVPMGIAVVAGSTFWNMLRNEDGVRIDVDATRAANRVEFDFLAHDLKFVSGGRVR